MSGEYNGLLLSASLSNSCALWTVIEPWYAIPAEYCSNWISHHEEVASLSYLIVNVNHVGLSCWCTDLQRSTAPRPSKCTHGFDVFRRHNDGVPNYRRHDCLPNRFFSAPDQRKHQSSASLTFVRRIHRWPVNSPHKGPGTRKMFPFDDVILKFRGLFHCHLKNRASLQWRNQEAYG